jgi:hypothetical protein
MMVVMRSLLKKKKREANYFSTYIEAINGASQDLMEQDFRDRLEMQLWLRS